MSIPRIPFDKAIADPRLLAPAWASFSPEQQVVMKATYGLPLDNADLAIWHALHGGGHYDDLGYLIDVHDSGVTYYPGREYSDITLIIGRRAAKSCILSFICTYEALCGGHKHRLQNQTQQPVFILVAQDLKRAMKNKNEYVLHYLKMSPVGRAELQEAADAKKQVTARNIRLPNCGIIEVGPPNIKIRGDSIAFAGFDEVAFWQTDEKSAAPDTEVERAVRPGMTQFYPYAKIVKVSTPWTEQGLLWNSYQMGTHGRHLTDERKQKNSERVLVLKGPSAVLKNPSLQRGYLAEEQAKDSEAFRREYLAEFSKSVSGFLPTALLRRAVDAQVSRRPAIPGVWYTCAIDPAFRRDAFAMSIGHMEVAPDGGQQFVQDFCQSWRGTTEEPLNPGLMLPLVGSIAREYGCSTIISDQHHQDSLMHIATEAGFSIEPFVLNPGTKNRMWRDFVTLINQDKARLLDHHELFAELEALEKTLTPNGTERIAGRRDDLAIVTAMCLHRALAFGAVAEKPVASEETTSDGIRAVLAQRHSLRQRRGAPRKEWWLR